MAKQPADSVYLSAASPRDEGWDKRKAQADGFRDLLSGTKYDDYSIRMNGCSCWLDFVSKTHDTTGLCSLKLDTLSSCRVRLCPLCQQRRSVMWQAKAYKILPKVLEENPKSRFIFLTLTVRNPQLDDLRSTLSWMHQSWRKMIQRKEWPAQGWIRSVELTRSHDDTAHCHYHCLLMVKPSYFSTGYLSQERWTEIWRQCLDVPYAPKVDIRVVKPPKGTPKSDEGMALNAALRETLKYAVKPSDILRRDNCQIPGERVRMTNQEWLLKLIPQLHKTRAVATGGILKDYLKVLEDEPKSLVHADDDAPSDSDLEPSWFRFSWKERAKRYQLREFASRPPETDEQLVARHQQYFGQVGVAAQEL